MKQKLLINTVNNKERITYKNKSEIFVTGNSYDEIDMRNNNVWNNR